MIIRQYSSCNGFQHLPQEKYKKKKQPTFLFRLYSNARMKICEKRLWCLQTSAAPCAPHGPDRPVPILPQEAWVTHWTPLVGEIEDCNYFPWKEGIPCRHASEAQTDLAPVLCTHRPMGEDLGLAIISVCYIYQTRAKLYTVYSNSDHRAFVKHLRPSCVVAITVW